MQRPEENESTGSVQISKPDAPTPTPIPPTPHPQVDALRFSGRDCDPPETLKFDGIMYQILPGNTLEKGEWGGGASTNIGYEDATSGILNFPTAKGGSNAR